MKTMTAMALALGMGTLFATVPAQAQHGGGAWCTERPIGSWGFPDCSYSSFQQCQETAWGIVLKVSTPEDTILAKLRWARRYGGSEKQFTDALNESPRLKLGNELTTANDGGPQTLLLIGSDKRAKGAIDASGPPHSDTMMLVRLDPNQPNTTVLSVPRSTVTGSASTNTTNAASAAGK